MGIRITGTGTAYPKKAVSNEMLSQIMDTSDEWIASRTGIRSRCVLSGEETLLGLSADAARAALERSGADCKDIDLLVYTTVQGDYITPSMSSLLSKALGIECRVFDINSACTGFIYAIDMVETYFAAGRAKKALIVCGEALSRITDWTDRSTAVLFGDGAAAVVVEPSEDLYSIILTSDGNDRVLFASSTQGNSPYVQANGKTPFLQMDGHEVYIFAVSSIVRDVRKILADNALTADDIKYFILHQANERIIESAAKRLKCSIEKFPMNIQNYANSSSVTIPSVIDMVYSDIERGDRIIICGFGAGLTTGCCLFEW